MVRIGCVMVVTGLITACGGSGTSSNPAPQPSVNSPPTITGSPSTIATQGEPYLFTPVATDLDRDTLTFSISILPAWASFDSTTGSLSGTPEAAHIGTTPNVTISVSDGTASASLTPFDLEVQQVPLGSATVSWDVPVTNADGSLLTDLDSYRVHYGVAPGTYSRTAIVDDATATTAPINNLEAGTWYFVVTAVDLTGNESALSAEVSKVVSP